MPGIEFDLSLFLTVGGAVAAAATVTVIVEVLKLLAKDFVTGHERIAAAIISAVFVAVAFYDASTRGEFATVTVPVLLLNGFLVWVVIARGAMVVHDEVARSPGAVTETSP